MLGFQPKLIVIGDMTMKKIAVVEKFFEPHHQQQIEAVAQVLSTALATSPVPPLVPVA